MPILLKLHIYLNHDLKICMCFLQNLELICFNFSHFHIFNFHFFHASILWKCICSRYLLSVTPPKVWTDPFENLQVFLSWSENMHVLFIKSLNYYYYYFFFYFFHIFNLDFFAWFWVCSGDLVSATPPTVLYLHRYLNHGLKICMWFLQNLNLIFFSNFSIFNLDFFHASVLWKCIYSRYLVSATPPSV